MTPNILVVGRKWAGRPMVEILRSYFRLPPQLVRGLQRRKALLISGKPCRDLTQIARTGDRIEIKADLNDREEKRFSGQQHAKQQHAKQQHDKHQRGDEGSTGENKFGKDPAWKIPIVYLDEDVLVVDKPAGLTTVRHASETAKVDSRSRRYLPATLVDQLARILPGKLPNWRGRIRAVHRLDRDTSGLVVLALTPEAERHLGLQFRAHSIGRMYLALVRGKASNQRVESMLVRDRGDGRRGSQRDRDRADEKEEAARAAKDDGQRRRKRKTAADDANAGQRAITHIRVRERLGDFSLVECELETGRTHQVRIHLGEQGTPLCGERVYDRPLHGKPETDASGAARPMLHAATLEFEHPATGKRLKYQRSMPRDMKQLRDKLRRSSPGK